MKTSADSVSSFLASTNALMTSSGVLPLPTAVSNSSLTFGRIGARIEAPGSMVYLSSRVSCDEFVSFLPLKARPSAADLQRLAVDRKQDFLPQWWNLQRHANEAISRMEGDVRPAQRALDLRREGESLERLDSGAKAAWPFLESAVILTGLGRPGRIVAAELVASARNFAAASLHASAAIVYELAFRADPSEREFAAKAAEQWLGSVKNELDPDGIRLRADRAFIFAAFSPYSVTFKEAARESGRINMNAGRAFEAGSDYLRAAWSMIQGGTPAAEGWRNISVYMATAAELFLYTNADPLAHEVGALSRRAAWFAQALTEDS